MGASLGRVTDEMDSTQDLGADWLDRLAPMMAVKEQFAGLEITDDDVDRIQVVGDLNFMSTTRPWPASGPTQCAFVVRTA